METKDQLINTIKEWISIDEEIKILKKEIKERLDKKKEISNSLISVMKNNEIDAFDINNGKLVYSKQKIKQTISKKLLISSLQNLFDSPVEAENICSHILNSRNEKITDIIKRKSIKN